MSISLLIAITGIFSYLLAVNAQMGSTPQWITGRGSASGTDLEAMRVTALNNARFDALKHAGVFIASSEVALKSESAVGITDFYSRFAESSTRGLILDERNLKISDPFRISPPTGNANMVYRIDVSIDGLVALQQGEPDPGFEVKLESDRDIYQEDDPVELRVSTTKIGYLNIFMIEGDSLTVVFPNLVDKNNRISPDKLFKFPSNDVYSMELEPRPNQKSTQEMFVAVVTRDSVAFPNLYEARLDNRWLKLKQGMLTMFATWLYKIPVHTRSADTKVLEVVAKTGK